MFALLLTDHPTWGYCFKPAILKRGKTNFEISSFFFTMSDCESLTAMERKVVQEAFKTTEAYIMKMFVKDKMTNVEFQKNYGPCFKNYTIIQSSVEKTNHKIASLAIENNIPIFRKKKNLLYLYDSDSIHLSKELNTSIPRFDLEKEGTLRYSLLIDNQKDIIAISDLFKSPPPIVMSHNPCCMIAKNELFVFREESYNKISAFSVKSHISVPAQNVDEYMRKFVYKTLLERNAMTSGFECDYENCQPVPILTITEDLKNCATFRLDFLYGETRIDIDYEKKRIVELKKEVGNYHFKIYERNLESEKNYIDKLKYFGLQFFNRFFYIDYKKENSAKNIIDFIQVNRFALSDYRIKQDLKGSTYILEKPTFVSELIEKDIDWFELKGKVTVDGIDIDFRKIRHNIIEGIREYKLPDGRIVILPEELFSKFSEVFRNAPKSDAIFVKKSQYSLLDDEYEAVREIKLKKNIQEEIPDGIRLTLRPYQKVGYSWLVQLYKQNFGGCLADDMGLGKTLQFLTFLRYVYANQSKQNEKNSTTKPEWIYETSEPSLFDQPISNPIIAASKQSTKKKPSLVILPTSLIFNWVNEKNKIVPSLSHYVYSGEKRLKSKDVGRIFSHYQLVFTSYGILRNDIEFLKDCEFECVIMDESHNLKNPESQIYKAVMQLKAAHFFGMTGTPIENGMMDLWAQMNIVNRNILGSANHFHKYFETPIKKGTDDERESVLRQIIKPFILRRTKEEVLKELPEKFTLEVYCEMNKEHRLEYDSLKSSIRNKLIADISKYGKPQEMTTAISSLSTLRQLANQVSMVDGSKKIPSTKVEEIMRRLKNLKEEGHKVLVFSSFVKFLDIIESELRNLGFNYSKITGQTKEREAEVARFQTDRENFCFLISLKAGGVGLNLTAADYVFIIDPWWNPAAEQQAEDRAYRIGQMKNVIVYRFIMKDTIEEKVLQLQNNKRIIANVFVNNNNPFDTLDKTEWESLFD